MNTGSSSSNLGENGSDSVASALDLLLEEIERARECANRAGSDAFSAGDHGKVGASLAQSKVLTEFYGKAVALRKAWRKLAMPASRGTGRRGPRRATKRMSARVERGRLLVQFADGEKSWSLPDPADKGAIRRIRDEAVAFALAHGATHPGQTNAVKKALTDAGYYLTR